MLFSQSLFVTFCVGMWRAPSHEKQVVVTNGHSCLAAFQTLNGRPQVPSTCSQLLSLRFSHLKPILGWLFMHLKGKAVPKLSPRFSEDTIIAFLSAAGDAFASME